MSFCDYTLRYEEKAVISMRHFEERDGLTDIPLYAVPVYFKSEEDEMA